MVENSESLGYEVTEKTNRLETRSVSNEDMTSWPHETIRSQEAISNQYILFDNIPIDSANSVKIGGLFL